MITTSLLSNGRKVEEAGDCSFGNVLFRIASVIGIATMNGYSYGFDNWPAQKYFVNKLPVCKQVFKLVKMPVTFELYDFGFCGFNFRDNANYQGYLGSWKYFEHCKEIIRYYFDMEPICEPYRDRILVHYRDYKGGGHKSWTYLDRDYYIEALKHLPKKKVIVVTDNIQAAYDAIGLDCEYTCNSPIEDFYLLSHADYLVMGNSTFSWWGSWLSDCPTVAPLNWYAGTLKNAPTKDLFYPKWKMI